MYQVLHLAHPLLPRQVRGCTLAPVRFIVFVHTVAVNVKAARGLEITAASPLWPYHLTSPSNRWRQQLTTWQPCYSYTYNKAVTILITYTCVHTRVQTHTPVHHSLPDISATGVAEVLFFYSVVCKQWVHKTWLLTKGRDSEIMCWKEHINHVTTTP